MTPFIDNLNALAAAGVDLAWAIVWQSTLLAAAVAVICLTVYLVHKNRTEIALKRELLDRGLTADEIATVISAKADKGLPRRSSRLN